MKTAIAIALLSITYVLGCSTKTSNSVSTVVNPNGDTELALLMRAMFDNGMEIKSAIESGRVPEAQLDISNLYTMDAANPERVRSPEYKAYARAYESAYAMLRNSSASEMREAYTTVVSTCMACHKAMCPGPIVKIRKMEM